YALRGGDLLQFPALAVCRGGQRAAAARHTSLPSGSWDTVQVAGFVGMLRPLGRLLDPLLMSYRLLAFLGFAYLHHDVLWVTAHLLAQLARIQASRESKLRRRRLELAQPSGRRRTAADVDVVLVDAERDLERAGVVAHVVLVAGIAVHALNLG